MDWSLEFYTKQNQWSGVYEEAIHEGHRQKAGWLEELIGPGPKRILELGAGGGQVAAAMAALGHEVVAVEQSGGVAKARVEPRILVTQILTGQTRVKKPRNTQNTRNDAVHHMSKG